MQEKKLVEWDKFVNATQKTKTLIAQNKTKITEVDTRLKDIETELEGISDLLTDIIS